MSTEEFVDRLVGFSTWEATRQIDYLTYFLTTEKKMGGIFPKDIQQLFGQLSLKEYVRTPQYLSEQAGSRTGRYIKAEGGGYRLVRHVYDQIKREIDNEPIRVQLSDRLAGLTQKIRDTSERSYLTEALNCYQVEAYRAAIVLTWVLAVHHLQSYIFGNRINEFNEALGKNPDKKISRIVNFDDFSELKEVRFIEVCRAAGVISNDVRKILDEKLGIRNSAAHPSTIVFSSNKTTEFILDLIDNVVLKY